MNATGGNDAAQNLNRLPRAQGIVYVVVFIVELLVVIIGNATAITVFLGTWQVRRRKCYWLCINLAVADLLVGVVNGPLWTYDLASRGCDLFPYKWNEATFKVVESVFLFLFYGSLINLTLISLERMYATLCPARHRRLQPKHYRALIAVGWTLSTIFPSFNIAMRYQQISSHTFSYVWISSNCFLLLVIFSSYASIGVKFKFYRHPHVTSGQDRRLTKSLFLVTVVSMVTWLPGVVLTVPTAAEALISYSSNYVFNHALNCAGLLIFANSMVNPIIYSFKMPVFRRAALRFRCRHRMAKPQTSESRTAKSRTAQSRTTKPRTTEPRTAKPRTAESRTAKPRMSEPRTAKPRTAESRTAESRTAKSRTTEPRTAESRTATAEPAQMQGIEMRDRTEVKRLQACAVISTRSEQNLAAADKLSFD